MAKGLSPEAQKLVEEFGLNADPKDPWADVFYSYQFKIITRPGIDKIIAKSGLEIVSLEPLFIDPYEIVYRGVFKLGDRTVTTTGSASIDRTAHQVITKRNEDGSSIQKVEIITLKKGNVKQNPPYLSEMAEKRCKSRGVLMLTGFYDQGFYGQDESDDFEDAIKDHRTKTKATAGVKTQSEKL